MAASYLEESFEGTGYENAWDVSQGSGCTIDPDNADVDRPTGGGAQVLKMVGAGNGVANAISTTLTGNKAVAWTTFYVRLNALSDNHNYPIFDVQDSAYAYCWKVKIGRSGSTYSLLLDMYYNGTLNSEIDSKVINLDTWYKVDVKYDVTGTAWEWRVDGSVEGSGSLPGTLTLGTKNIEVRTTAWNDGFATTVYVDRIWIDDSEYGYGEAPAADYVKFRWTK